MKTLTRHYRPQFRYNPRSSRNHLPRAATEGETSIPLDRPHRSVSSTHLPPTTTIGSLASSYDLSEESESTINSIDSIEEDGKGGMSNAMVFINSRFLSVTNDKTYTLLIYGLLELNWERVRISRCFCY